MAQGWGKVMARRVEEQVGPELDLDADAIEQFARARPVLWPRGRSRNSWKRRPPPWAPNNPAPSVNDSVRSNASPGPSRSGARTSNTANRSVIKGPRQAESIARELLGHKAEILALLAGAACDPAPERTAEPIPTPEPGCPAGPASALYRLIQHSKPADRPVMTPWDPASSGKCSTSGSASSWTPLRSGSRFLMIRP